MIKNKKKILRVFKKNFKKENNKRWGLFNLA
jgi:hypothetical protein